MPRNLTLQQLASMTPEEVAQQFTPAELSQIRTGLYTQLQGQMGTTPGSGVGLWDRAKLSFTSTPEGAERVLRESGRTPMRLPNGDLGVVEGNRVRAVNPRGLDLGDIAGLAGDVPATVLGAIGGVAGLASPVPGGAFLGAGAGSALGEGARQVAGQLMGSGEAVSPGRMALEGALGVAGEGVGRVAGRLLSGPFRRAANAPQVAKTMEQAANFDTRFGTDLAGQAPADVVAESGFLGRLAQKVRESPYGGQALRDRDAAMRREIEAAFDAVKRESAAAGPAGTVGPYAGSVGHQRAGADLKEAAQSTLGERMTQRKGLYDAFTAEIDPTQAPALDNTRAALAEIQGTNLFRRKKVGAQGLGTLSNAVEEARGIANFADLETLRQAVGDEVAQWDATVMAKGVQAQLKKLHGALRADEAAFLDAGGGAGSATATQAGRAAKSYARDLFHLEESPILRQVFGNELRLSEIPTKIRSMTPEEVRALKQIVGAGDVTPGGLAPTQEGMQRWQQVGAEIIDDLKRRVADPKLSTADEFVLSGQRLQTELRHFKDGALEEILGADTASDLRNFADLARNLTVSERLFANFSGTAAAVDSPLNVISQLFLHPVQALGSVAGRVAATAGAGRVLGSQRGSRYLMGQLPVQENYRTMLEALGRLGAQGGMRLGTTPVTRGR